MRNVRLVGLDVMLIPNDFARRARSTHACSFALDMSTIDSEIVLSYPRHRAAQRDSSDQIITEEFSAHIDLPLPSSTSASHSGECRSRKTHTRSIDAGVGKFRLEAAPTNRSTASSELASFGTLVREPN